MHFLLYPTHRNKYRSLILYGITSRCDSFKVRSIIRRTFIKRLKYYESYAFFFVGLSTNKYNNILLKTEAEIYNDVIQISFYESYFNLTTLTLWMIKWIMENCFFKYFIKNDQDVIPNVKLIYRWLKQDKEQKCAYGILSSNERTHRSNKSKSYIPYSSYKDDILPIYAFGYFAIYNYQILFEINRISFSIYPIIYKEDVHLGLLVSKTNYSFCRIKYKIIQRLSKNISVVDKDKIIAIHGIKDKYNKVFILLNL